MKPVLGALDDPKLPPTASTWRCSSTSITNSRSRRTMLRRIRDALKPGGRLVLLEYRKEDPSIPIRPEHKMSVAEAKLEVEAEGFKLRVDDGLPRQHILIFNKQLGVLLLHRTDVSLPVPAGPARAVLRARFSRQPRRATRNWLLLVASIIFYAKGGGAFTWLMLGVDRLQLLDGDRDRSRRASTESSRVGALGRCTAAGRRRTWSCSASSSTPTSSPTTSTRCCWRCTRRRSPCRRCCCRSASRSSRSTRSRTSSTSTAATRRRRRARSTRRSTCCSFPS